MYVLVFLCVLAWSICCVSLHPKRSERARERHSRTGEWSDSRRFRHVVVVYCGEMSLRTLAASLSRLSQAFTCDNFKLLCIYRQNISHFVLMEKRKVIRFYLSGFIKHLTVFMPEIIGTFFICSPLNQGWSAVLVQEYVWIIVQIYCSTLWIILRNVIIVYGNSSN